MARPRIPTAVQEAKGAFVKDPARGRARANEPEANGPIGSPPAYFDKHHKDAWHELVSEAAPGVLCRSDRKHLELTVRLLCKMRVAPGRMPKWLRFLAKACQELGMPERDVEEMQDAIRAGLGCNAQELGLLATSLTRIGMTPADRSKVHGEKLKEHDPFADDDEDEEGGSQTIN